MERIVTLTTNIIMNKIPTEIEKSVQSEISIEIEKII
jgi:hypothetical protein